MLTSFKRQLDLFKAPASLKSKLLKNKRRLLGSLRTFFYTSSISWILSKLIAEFVRSFPGIKAARKISNVAKDSRAKDISVVLMMLPYSNHVYTPPLQLAYLKGYLGQDKDIKVRILDAESHCFRSHLINRSPGLYWEKIGGLDARGDAEFYAETKPVLDEIVNMILAQNPRVVGFSITCRNFFFTRYVSQQIKRLSPQIYIIYGGILFGRRKKWDRQIADMHRGLPEADCIVKNEGEATLLEVVRTLKAGKLPAHCAGATVRLDRLIVDGGERALIEDVDNIPFPDFSDYKKEDYLSDYIRILFWRGCIGQCVYCAENYTMGRIRCRSAQNIIDEIKLRLGQGYRRSQASDLSLNPSLARLTEVCRRIIEEGLNIEFVFSEFRHTPDFTLEVFRLLRRAGFKSLVFGTETGSQLILDRMKKGISVEAIERNMREAHEAGLEVMSYFMVGFPGETEETFLETLRFLERNRHYIDGTVGVNPTAIIPFTPIHDNLRDYDLNISTLFQRDPPDRWGSIDGKNCYEWRLDLAQRMTRHLSELGIPGVDFYQDGNPRVPARPDTLLVENKG